MLHPRLARFALLGIAFLLVVPSIPAANTPIEGTLTKSYPEDYESFATVPTAPTTPWATFNTAGAGTAQVTATTLTGSTRALSVTDDAIAGFVHQQVNTGSGVNLCLQDQTLAFTFTLTSSMTTGQSVELRASTAGATAGTQPADSFGLILTGQIGAGELASVYMRGDTGGTVTPTSIGTFTLPAVGTVLMDTIICSGSTPQVRFVISGGGLSFTGTYTAAVAFVGTVNRFSVAHISSAAAFAGTVDVDDFLWSGAPLPAPTVTTINPTQGNAAGGEAFTVTGTGFKTGAQVLFGTADATGESVTATSITGLTPPHAAGVVSVIVVNPDTQTGTLVNGYTYNPAPRPVVTAIAPNSGIEDGGDTVNVTGQNFRTGFTATFDGVVAVSSSFVSSTRVQLVTPPHDPGAVTLEICNTDGQCGNGVFTYTSLGSNPALSEKFENDVVGNRFGGEPWYDSQVSQGASTRIVNTQSVSAPNSWYMQSTTSFHLKEGSFCGTVSSFDYRLEDGVQGVGFANGNDGVTRIVLAQTGIDSDDMIGFSFRTINGEMYKTVQLPDGTIDDWHHYDFYINCESPRSSDVIVDGTISSTTGLATNGYWVANPTFPSGSSPLDYFAQCASSGCTQSGYVDNIQINFPGGPSGGESARCIFCSASGNDNFGYEYVEEVDAVGDQRYRFRGNTDDFAYLGKSWTGGTKIVSSYFAIQAATDSESSVFRSNFGTLGTTPSGTTKGNGKTTGHFAEHIEAQFKETGNDWNVRLYHVSASNGVTSKTQLGTAVIQGNPNAMEFYNFTVNTVLGKAYVTKTELFGNNPGQEIALFPGGVTLPAYWSGAAFLDHWFVGYGTGVAGTGPFIGFPPAPDPHLASTFLSDGGRWPLSTCIYSFEVAANPTPNGDPGRSPPTADGTTVAELTSGGVGTTGNTTEGEEMFGAPAGSFFLPADAVLPDGFTRSSFSFLLGVLFMFAVAGGAYFVLGRSPMAAGIGAGGGFMGAFAFGLFPLWAVLLVALACAAIFVLRFKANGG